MEAVGIVGVIAYLGVVKENIMFSVLKLGIIEKILACLDYTRWHLGFLASMHDFEGIFRVGPTSNNFIKGDLIRFSIIGGYESWVIG